MKSPCLNIGIFFLLTNYSFKYNMCVLQGWFNSSTMLSRDLSVAKGGTN